MKRLIISLLVVLMGLTCRADLPEITLQDIDGHEVNVASLTQLGKPVIISFFATWCGPCKNELEAIHELYPDWQEKYGVEMYIVSVDTGQDTQKVKPLVNGRGWEYKVLLDPNGTFSRAMNITNIPKLYVIDSKGKIVYNHLGYSNGDEMEIEKYLR